MVETLNTKIVKDTFDKAYTEEQFKLFIRDLLNRRQYENICVYISNYDSTIFEKLL